MSNYQVLRLPNGYNLKFHKGIFSHEQYKETQEFEQRIYFERKNDPFKGSVYSPREIAADVTHQERLNAYLGVLRQIKIEGGNQFLFMSGSGDKAALRFVEYSIYAYRYTDGVELDIETIGLCKLSPDDEYEMRMLYLLAKYLKQKAGFIDSQNRVQLPPISPVKK